MKLTERADWIGGAPDLEIKLQVLHLISGAEIRLFSDTYGVGDDDIDFTLFTENDQDGPLLVNTIASVPLAVVELSPGGWPVFPPDPAPGPGITTPSTPTVAARPGVRLFSVHLTEMGGHREEIRIRAHNYRIWQNTLWFYFEIPQTSEVFDIASLPTDLLAGPTSQAVTEIV
ncbi:hypothetical protein ACTD5D_21440 [Nocardia takedensis]|uniref:hypothetical protein n=1 Tax=Nocardia takedensis TaxID=259390 RepID=UPI003F76E6E8